MRINIVMAKVISTLSSRADIYSISLQKLRVPLREAYGQCGDDCTYVYSLTLVVATEYNLCTFDCMSVDRARTLGKSQRLRPAAQ